MKRILIDRGLFYTRIAAAKDNSLLDIRVHESLNKSIVGNVYRGKVHRILPGIRAAFVDIGEGKNAYLPIGKNSKVKQGADVLVQVEKDGMGDKGPKISLEISLAGKHMILIPQESHESIIKISNKISDEHERSRLLSVVEEMCPTGFGAVVRTNAANAQKAEFEGEISRLASQWEAIKSEYVLGIGPKLLLSSIDTVTEYIRDNFNQSFCQIVVNDPDDYEKIKLMLKINKSEKDRLLLFDETSDIFDYYNIKKSIKSLTNRKLWLESGAHIIIEPTEALTVIDVNTGRKVKGFDVEKTILEANMEAADEAVRQIKLRDIGGIVIIDFIDMKSAGNRQRLVKRLEENFADEPGRAFVHGITQLGLVEITRKNQKKGIELLISKECPYCHGAGKISSDYFVLDSIEKEASRMKKHTNAEAALFHVSCDFYDSMEKDEFKHIYSICKKYGIEIIVAKDHFQKPGKASVKAMGGRAQVMEKLQNCFEFKGIYPLTKEA
ncbi:ribonuclease G [Peptoclostridium litorale DSM 5388]|uniref:Ribonuclease G n=1 Tax=Peptoclostridium litorale DSM 5388 TaxID=1121324 RepID=A0A069RCV0_PEPLI|nr:Rne/Rng family ribonuclease [Peptoclostridium litorale]KDR94070.1 ribonuclease G [Peptoclostridium litorale DSM 5388]SIN80465.1 ribonuclease G [Peptoclostridium litorale DSM 5388]